MFVVKVPGSNGTSGCEKSGNSMIEELGNINYNEQGKLVDRNLLDLEEIHIDNKNLKLTNDLIFKNGLETFDLKPKSVFLGGDHSISYSLVKSFEEHCRANGKLPSLVIFDACPDCSPADKFPTNKQWLRKIIDEGFPADGILLVGVRNYNKGDRIFIAEKRISVIDMTKIFLDIEDICDTIMEFSNGKDLYVSLDLGVVDPVYAPSTYHKETGGLSSRQIIYLIQRLNKVKRLRAVDIVEINSEEDKQNNNRTVKLGAKILAELI